MAADGVSQREIVKRLGITRRTVRRMLESHVQPRYQRGATGSMFDPLKPSPERGVVAVAGALVAGLET
jgi:hypothetical protein